MKKIILNVLVIVMAATMFFTINTSIEKSARLQNNFNLDSVVGCVENELITHNEEKTPSNLTKALNSCAKGQRSLGITGDIFVIRLSDKKLFWDSSADCKPESELKLYMTEDGVCSLFSKPETCLAAVKSMIAHPPKGSLEWQFDNDVEWVDYRYLPFDVNGDKYIIGQGTQKDEANNTFNLVYTILVIGSLIIIILTSFI